MIDQEKSELTKSILEQVMAMGPSIDHNLIMSQSVFGDLIREIEDRNHPNAVPSTLLGFPVITSDFVPEGEILVVKRPQCYPIMKVGVDFAESFADYSVMSMGTMLIRKPHLSAPAPSPYWLFALLLFIFMVLTAIIQLL